MNLTGAWDVFLLFVIPLGGGVPSGIVLAKNRGLHWLVMLFLYLISDVVLAIVFEPLLVLFLRMSENSPRLLKMREALAKSTKMTIGRLGVSPGPFSLVAIAFGTDPMTGRSVAKVAGHGFLSGWTFAIVGDMLFFTVLMVSTLWLDNVLGNGTWAAIIITVAMMALPPFIRLIRERWRRWRLPPA